MSCLKFNFNLGTSLIIFSTQGSLQAGAVGFFCL